MLQAVFIAVIYFHLKHFYSCITYPQVKEEYRDVVNMQLKRPPKPLSRLMEMDAYYLYSGLQLQSAGTKYYLWTRRKSNKTVLYTQRGLVNTWANKNYHRDSAYYKISCFTFLFKTVLFFLLLTLFTDISMPFLIFFCRLHVKRRCEMELLGILRRQLMQLCNLSCCLCSIPFLLG